MCRSTKQKCFVPLNNVLTFSIVLCHKSNCAKAYSFCAQAHLNVPGHNITIDRDHDNENHFGIGKSSIIDKIFLARS